MQSDLRLFIFKNGDVRSNSGWQNKWMIIEAFAMLYESSTSIEIKKLIIKRSLELCEKSKQLYNYPCPYKIISKNINKNIVDDFLVDESRNTQHFLWCAKMFYKHFEKTKSKQYYNKSEEIVNYVCEKMYDRNHLTLINWFGDSCVKNKVSVKSLTCLEMLLIFKKNKVLESTINFMKENLFNKETGLFDSTFDIKYKKRENNKSCYLHENLEFIEGLYNGWKYTGDDGFKCMAINLIEKVIPLISSNINNLAPLQCLYWMELFELEWGMKNDLAIYNQIKERINKILLTQQNTGMISPYEKGPSSNINNIFGHIYLSRLERKVN